MSADSLFALVSEYGVVTLALSCFLSCLLVPIPSSFLMLAGGAFVASGDLVGWQVVAAAWGGAVAGDQTGYHIGRRNGARLLRLTGTPTRRTQMLNKAQQFIARHGGLGVFFSTWAVAPLGPYVNIIAGAGGLTWRQFTLWDAVGEAIWVTGYTGLGFFFAANLATIAALASNLSGLLAAATVSVLLFTLILHRLRHPHDA